MFNIVYEYHTLVTLEHVHIVLILKARLCQLSVETLDVLLL